MGHFDIDADSGESKAEFVYRTLRSDILDGAYPPGTVLYTRELSAQLGVSRTPVKEAISRLAFEGHVELLPNRCAVVSRISATEIIELLELRETLERATAYYAALRHTEADIMEMQQIEDHHRTVPAEDLTAVYECDQRFHMAVCKASYNRQLAQALETVFAKLKRVSVAIGQARLPDSLVQHTNILNAIREGNAEGARRYMAEHDQDILTSIKLFQYQNIHLFKT